MDKLYCKLDELAKLDCKLVEDQFDELDKLHCMFDKLAKLAVCRAYRGLPVGFLLLWYSVLYTVESLSLLYLIVIS